MITAQKVAHVFSGKTTRACESCVRKRARWYRGADDAFLCHVCDALVHSANQLAGKHERIRLEVASSNVRASVTTTEDTSTGIPQAWYNGFTRKTRTLRPNKSSLFVQQNKSVSTLVNVPELGYEAQAISDENDEQLLYKVLVFKPFEVEICNIYNEDRKSDQRRILLQSKRETILDGADDDEGIGALDNFSEFLPSDVDLAEFAADVENLLTKAHDDENSSQKQDLEEPADCEGKEPETPEVCQEVSRSNAMVKEEEHEGETLVDSNLKFMIDMTSCATISWNFDYESLVIGEEDYKLSTAGVETNHTVHSENHIGKKNMLLRLNYDEVITAWANLGSPWTTGHPPEVNLYIGWPDCLGTSTSSTVQHSCAGVESSRGISIRSGDSCREARVSRYREKRRTRLFAKKIRYEVGKLNAESKPRMKGRFVKRTSLMEAATSFPYCYVASYQAPPSQTPVSKFKECDS